MILRDPARRLACRYFSEVAKAPAAVAEVKPVPAIPKPTPTKRRRKWRYVALMGGAFMGWRTYENYARDRHRRNLMSTTEESALPTRARMVEDLKSFEVDVLVIGGGATGCGVALDAATRGLSVACVEQEDFGSGASSKSTKLFWGGSRYLIQGAIALLSTKSLEDPKGALLDFWGAFKMVLSCLHERNLFVERQQHLARWIPVALPYDRWLMWPNPPFDFYPAVFGPCLGIFPFFFKIYDLLGNFACPSSYIMSSATGKDVIPQLSGPNGTDVKYLSVFYEAQHNDARTNVSIALTAAARGATMANYVTVESFILDKTGKAVGAKCLDVLSGDRFSVHARSVVCAGGPFTDNIRKFSNTESSKEQLVTGAGGTHIILPGHFCPRHLGYVNMQTSDERFLFYLPWLGHTIVGTTESKTTEQQLDTAPTEEDIEYIFKEMKKYLHPSIALARSDVLSAWHGVRPLISTDGMGSGPSRDHYIEQDSTSKVWIIAGGKWTTYREMAEDVLDQLCLDKGWVGPKRTCTTRDVLLIGEGPVPECHRGWHKHIGIQLANTYKLAEDIVEHLSRTYGTRSFELLNGAREEEKIRLHPAFPILEAEVRYAVKTELAQTASDILCRRTRLAFLNVDVCNDVIPRVCAIIGDELGWNAARIKREIAATQARIAREFLGPRPK